MNRYLVLMDTPGIKQFVFGTDALAEIRGASALLDRLNRDETETQLQQSLKNGVQKIFANGGTGQFIVQAEDATAVRRALDELSRNYGEQSGGEVRVIAGISEYPEDSEAAYHGAVERAFGEIRLSRNLGSHAPAVPTLPFVQECDSCSHLPAEDEYSWGDEQLWLSRASRLKREESRLSRRGQLWSGWIEHLGLPPELADKLRPDDAVAVGDRARPKNHVGLVYADGNAMGRIVQELSSPDVCAAFSQLVDGSVRQACYKALSHVCRAEVSAARAAVDRQEPLRPLPADILLLGGDDLLVLLPADRALPFALQVTEAFGRLTCDGQGAMAAAAKNFFSQRELHQRGLTISCGVVLGPARYPFYLLLDLVEQLLKSAKHGGSGDQEKTDYWAPSYIDFHVIAGSSGQELPAIRDTDYLVRSDLPRTLRPYRLDRLRLLQRAAGQLRRAKLPRSKLHALFEAALEPRPRLAQRRAEELFGRLRHDRRRDERRALRNALEQLGPLKPYPWTEGSGTKATGLADLIEAHDIFGFDDEVEDA